MLVDRRKKRARRKMLVRMSCLVLLGALAAGWWFWGRPDAQKPRFNSLVVDINGETRKVLPGETLTFRPKDRIEISDISTNIPFDHNVRLASKGMDVNALQFEALPLVELLPEKDGFRRYEFRVHVKHLNQDLGYVDWIVQPWAEDWLEKANRLIDEKKRLTLLERGHEILPADERIENRLIQEYMRRKKWKSAIPLLEKKAGELFSVGAASRRDNRGGTPLSQPNLEGGRGEKSDIKTLNALLSAYTALNDEPRIVAVLGRMLQLQPNDLEKRLQLAKIYEKRNEFENAIAAYERVLANTPSNQGLSLQKTLGYLYTETGRFEKAIAAYLAAANLDQKDANLHYNLAELYERTGRRKEADFYLDNAVTLNAGDVEGRLTLADRLYSRGSLKEARHHAEQVLRRNPDFERALSLMALILEEQGDKKALKRIYRKILARDPKNEAVSYNLGVLEYEDGNLKEALPYFESYGDHHPEDVTVQEILFDIYHELKKPEKAYGRAVVLISLKPHDMGAYGFIFDHLIHKKAYEALISVLEKGISQNPHETTLRRKLLEAYMKKGDEKGAIRAFEALLVEKKGVSNALLHEMFEFLVAGEKYRDIIDVMKKVVSAEPDRIAAREYLVVAYLKTGRENSAIVQMEKILDKTPDNLELNLQLARLAEKKNKIKKAVGAYKKVLELSPDHSEASDAYLRLRLQGVGAE